MSPTWLHPSHAITRQTPNSFADALQISSPPISIDVQISKNQHDAYGNLIKTLVPNRIDIPADESVPDCQFVEDTAFFVPVEGENSSTGRPLECICIITRPGADSRKAEVRHVTSLCCVKIAQWYLSVMAWCAFSAHTHHCTLQVAQLCKRHSEPHCFLLQAVKENMCQPSHARANRAKFLHKIHNLPE